MGLTDDIVSLVVSGGIGLVQLVAVIPAILWLDEVGRRPLLRGMFFFYMPPTVEDSSAHRWQHFHGSVTFRHCGAGYGLPFCLVGSPDVRVDVHCVCGIFFIVIYFEKSTYLQWHIHIHICLWRLVWANRLGASFRSLPRFNEKQRSGVEYRVELD